ncbi:hypothetical protein HPB50_015452 [Hyalomma asiaticum]|uniref:Uncharacterized protein n=1 Tax=Hyalomma asiaticum TaxID=266040 RepID=A0ACB7SWA4_HYAAI|nr:hypothetical protein HPB50_015452 [Hyalomma asiaticum]
MHVPLASFAVVLRSANPDHRLNPKPQQLRQTEATPLLREPSALVHVQEDGAFFRGDREKNPRTGVLRCRGNNLYDVRKSSDKTWLAIKADTLRRTAWIRRGEFLVVQPTKEGSQVTAEIHRILSPYQVKHIRDQGMWSQAFAMEDD